MTYNTQKTGFTIVELLIVIVVIAILAAISIVAYNGIQGRSRASAAQTLAGSIAKKAEMYNLDSSASSYPATLNLLTAPAESSKTYYIDASSVTLTTAALSGTTTKPERTIRFMKCGHTGTATAPTSAATVTNQTGVKVEYWNNGTLDSVSTGQVTGFGNPPTNTFTVNCWPAAS